MEECIYFWSPVMSRKEMSRKSRKAPAGYYADGTAKPTDVEGCVNPGFGFPYTTSPYILPDGTAVYMWRKGQRVRFYDADGKRHGPEQRNVAPATVYAIVHGWRRPGVPEWMQAAGEAEVRSKVRPVTRSRR